MRKIRYVASDDVLEIDGGYRTRNRRGVPAAPFDQLFDVSLVSFRDAAATRAKASGMQDLKLTWTNSPAEIFEEGSPALSLHSLVSDGVTVWLNTLLYVAERDGYPDDSTSAAALVGESVGPLVGEFDGTLEVFVAPFVPGDLRRVDFRVALPPQRRSIGEASALGDSLRDQANQTGRQLLGNPNGILSALRFAPQALIGQFESQWLEVKRELYDLARDGQKIELSKDVAAFANSGGGLIIFGFSTRSKPAGDKIVRARSIDTAALQRDRYMQVLRARIHPCPEQVDMGRIGGAKAGFAYIRIPTQPEELRPFMLRETSSKRGVRTTR